MDNNRCSRTLSALPITALLLTLTPFICPEPAGAQVVMERSVSAGEGVFLLQELGIVLTGKDKSVQVEMVLPKHVRPEGYEELEIKQGDQVLMINRKRVKTVDELKAVYESLAVDEEIKLGIQRGPEMRLLAFDKVDPKILAKDGRVMMTTTTMEGSPEAEEGGVHTRTMTVGGDADLRPLFGTGLILRTTDAGVEVAHLMQGMTEGLGDADVRQGDFVVSINGQRAQSLDSLFETWESIPVGEAVTLELRREEKTLEADFAKPETEGKFMMKTR